MINKAKKIVSVSTLAYMLAVAGAGEARQVTVAWDPNPVEEGVTGYVVYHGKISRMAQGFSDYDFRFDVGDTTKYTLSLVGGGNHYIAVAAYNSLGLRSVYSVELTVLEANSNSSMANIATNSGGVIDSAAGSITFAHETAYSTWAWNKYLYATSGAEIPFSFLTTVGGAPLSLSYFLRYADESKTAPTEVNLAPGVTPVSGFFMPDRTGWLFGEFALAGAGGIVFSDILFGIPPPDNVIVMPVITPTETKLALDWTAVAGATEYRIRLFPDLSKRNAGTPDLGVLTVSGRTSACVDIPAISSPPQTYEVFARISSVAGGVEGQFEEVAYIPGDIVNKGNGVMLGEFGWGVNGADLTFVKKHLQVDLTPFYTVVDCSADFSLDTKIFTNPPTVQQMANWMVISGTERQISSDFIFYITGVGWGKDY